MPEILHTNKRKVDGWLFSGPLRYAIAKEHFETEDNVSFCESSGAGLSSFEAGLLTIGYLVAILATIRVGERLLQKWGPRKPMLLGCSITAVGILLTCLSFLYAWQYMIAAVIGFTLFGIGLGCYATPSTDAALSNVPQNQVGSAAGIYKMASSLGAALGVAISAALFTGLSSGHVVYWSELFIGRTDNVEVRFAAAVALLFNVLMTLIAIAAIIKTVPESNTKNEVATGSVGVVVK